MRLSPDQLAKAIAKRNRFIRLHYGSLLGVAVICALAWGKKLWPDSLFTIFNGTAVVIGSVYFGIGMIYSLTKKGKTLKDFFYANYHRKVARRPVRSAWVSIFLLLFAAAGTTTIVLTQKYSFRNSTGEPGSLKINFANGSSEVIDEMGRSIEKRYLAKVMDVYFCCDPVMNEEKMIRVPPQSSSPRSYEFTRCQEE